MLSNTSLSCPLAYDPNDSTEAIEDEIATLSALIGAATYRLICLIGELDRKEGWADPLDPRGFRSCAHWLSWRVGLSLGVARQYVRIARALPALARISTAFGAGELSYSKVRAITRIATPDNEEMVLGWARAGTASQVERLVRDYRRADPERENYRALEQRDSRSLLTWFDGDGMLVVRGRLSPEQGALLVKALEVSAHELTADADGSSEPSGANGTASAPASATASGSRITGDQLKADALARVAERALACDAAQASSSDRFQVVVHVDAEVLADPAADGRCHLEDGPALAPEVVRRLACEATVSEMRHGPDGELTAGRKTRAISTPLRRALRARDGSRCAFPGCPCRGRDAHHVESWAEGGPTVLFNLLSLCRLHHTFVHEGGYRFEPLPGGRFRFLRPDGREVVAAPAVGPVDPDPVSALVTRWLPPDLSVSADTGRPTWDCSPWTTSGHWRCSVNLDESPIGYAPVGLCEWSGGGRVCESTGTGEVLLVSYRCVLRFVGVLAMTLGLPGLLGCEGESKAVLGDRCVEDVDCQSGLCASFPTGSYGAWTDMCTTDCSSSSCPDGSYCAMLAPGNYLCAPACNLFDDWNLQGTPSYACIDSQITPCSALDPGARCYECGCDGGQICDWDYSNMLEAMCQEPVAFGDPCSSNLVCETGNCGIPQDSSTTEPVCLVAVGTACTTADCELCQLDGTHCTSACTDSEDCPSDVPHCAGYDPYYCRIDCTSGSCAAGGCYGDYTACPTEMNCEAVTGFAGEISYYACF